LELEAAVAVLLAVVLAATPVLTVTGRLRTTLAALGVVAILLLAASLAAGRVALAGWPAALLMAEEAAAIVAHRQAGAGLASAAVPLYAAGLLLAAELADHAAWRRGGAGPEPPRVAWRRVTDTGALALASVALGSGCLLLAAAVPTGGAAGTWLRVAAVVAAVATVAVVVALTLACGGAGHRIGVRDGDGGGR